jgi:hypothetical protein
VTCERARAPGPLLESHARGSKVVEMPRLLVAAPLAALALAAGACATVSVTTDFDRAADFSRYRTFTLAGGNLQINGLSDNGNTLVKDRIQNALRATLTAKGLVETSTAPDLFVGYLAGARSRTEIEGMPPYAPDMGPYWYGGWWGPGYAEWWTRTYEEGTLVVDLVDASSHKLAWRAYARSEIKPPVSEQKVRDVVESAFKGYPPHH